ncbi:hypothetical protein MNBD_GAMMA17-2019 [hydrothermal vent metagenome]|uniref:Uncharacterized protein n=1 Tax=hydrothermal vent metagenome TaxID=652676 RepID=A0A3B0ZW28_9ZZZZ
MTRYKTHLIAVKKFNDKEEMIMRDIRDAMEYLAIMMIQQHSGQSPKVKPPERQSPATHIYCYDAKVIPFPHSHN